MTDTSIIPMGMNACSYCGPNIYHSGICPRVKAISYHPDGSIQRVEFDMTMFIAPNPRDTDWNAAAGADDE